jgi:hypothetical protein
VAPGAAQADVSASPDRRRFVGRRGSDRPSLDAALDGLDVTHVFFCTWSRQNTEVWAKLVAEHDLAPYKASELASWWHTDTDLGRQVETFADMSKSRALGFLDCQPTAESFSHLFDELRTLRIIPA